MALQLVCNNLHKDYQLGKTKVTALKGVTMQFNPGLNLIRGASGSGKSTLLNLIGTLDKPSRGEIFLDGKEISKMSNRKQTLLRRNTIGFIFQHFSLISTLSVRDNVEYPLLSNQGISTNERHQRADHLLERVGLAGYQKRLPRELSGGQMQRVAIARALITRPKLILADEPTANLDSETGKSIFNLLLDLQTEQETIIIIASHDSMLINTIERRITMSDGIIKEDNYV